MKAHRETPPAQFTPVILTLQSQAEVDGMTGLLRNAFLTDAAGLDATGYYDLSKFANEENSSKVFADLQKIVSGPQ